MNATVTMPRMSKKKPSSVQASAPASSPDEGKPEAPKRPVIYLEVPDRLAGLKEALERLAEEHNRQLTGECLQALVEYATQHKAWPPSPPPTP